MSSIRDKLNSIAKNERLFSLNELYDNQGMSWNEYFTELVKKVEAIFKLRLKPVGIAN